MTQEDGFIIYKNPRRRRKPKSFNKISCVSSYEENDNFEDEEIVKKVNQCLEILKEHSFMDQFKKTFNRFSELKTVNQLTSIVCYGLGNISQCIMSRYQFALLITLTEITHCKNVDLYDPAFTQQEKTILTDYFKFNLIDKNEECKRTLCSDETILFYMPHCDKSLYNNVLWSNWHLDKLNNVIILGNSFTNMINSILSKQTLKLFNYIYHSVDTFSNSFIELLVVNNFDHKEVFNDLAFQAFDVQKIQIQIDIFENIYSSDEPKYDEET